MENAFQIFLSIHCTVVLGFSLFTIAYSDGNYCYATFQEYAD